MGINGGNPQFILSIDPGKSTGVAYGLVYLDMPYRLEEAWQFGGGLDGLLDAIPGPLSGVIPARHTICEKFQPISHANYSLTTDSVEPLRCEGALIALGIMADFPGPTWRKPADQYFVGGKTLPEKKKRSRKFLKDTGNYRLPKQLGAPDNNDAISATLHGINYAIKVLESKATFDLVREWVGDNPVD